MCSLILWRPGLGLLMGKFRQFLKELSAHDTPIFSFQDNNCSKCQWIFTKLVMFMCIYIVEICFGIANGQILSIFDSYQPTIHPVFTFRTITWVNLNGFSPNLICAFMLWSSALGFLIVMGKFRPFLIELSARNTSGVYFRDNNLSKSLWIFTKFDMCIYIVELNFGIAHWQISSIFDRVICLQHDNGGVLSFHVLFELTNSKWSFAK